MMTHTEMIDLKALKKGEEIRKWEAQGWRVVQTTILNSDAQGWLALVTFKTSNPSAMAWRDEVYGQ